MFSIHCTITSQMLNRSHYLSDFVEFWSARPEVKRIWFSIYTPQRGESTNEILSPEQRQEVVRRLLAIKEYAGKLDMAPSAIRKFVSPPASPQECTFARTTTTISADLKSRVMPCQFGGDPDCSQCGCVASVGLHALTQHKLLPFLRVGHFFDVSFRIGELVARKKSVPSEKKSSHPSTRLVTLPPNSGAQ